MSSDIFAALRCGISFKRPEKPAAAALSLSTPTAGITVAIEALQRVVSPKVFEISMFSEPQEQRQSNYHHRHLFPLKGPSAKGTPGQRQPQTNPLCYCSPSRTNPQQSIANRNKSEVRWPQPLQPQRLLKALR